MSVESPGHRGLRMEEALIFEQDSPGHCGVDLPAPIDVPDRLGGQRRDVPIGLPGLSEPQIVRHFTRLSQKNYGIDSGLYPLGSCTMKHNPRLNEKLARQAYAASDFVLMPSRFEPCGLPQMIGPVYGALPVAHDTGGIHDTITHLNVEKNEGNGFLFETFDSSGLLWAMDQALRFHLLQPKIKTRQISRIMTESLDTFNHDVTARRYIDLYEKMLDRPLIN